MPTDLLKRVEAAKDSEDRHSDSEWIVAERTDGIQSDRVPGD